MTPESEPGAKFCGSNIVLGPRDLTGAPSHRNLILSEPDERPLAASARPGRWIVAAARTGHPGDPPASTGIPPGPPNPFPDPRNISNNGKTPVVFSAVGVICRVPDSAK